jgi:hypothetical protein
VPPIYHPQIVVNAILYASENPIARLVAGGAGVGVVLAERFSPRFAEWMANKVGFVGQTTDEKAPEDSFGNLFEPVGNFDTVEGRFSGEQLMSDPVTWLATHPAEKTVLLTIGGIVGGLLAWRILRKKQR